MTGRDISRAHGAGRRGFCIALGASLLSGFAHARPRSDARARRSVVRIPRPLHHRLDNGLEVILQRDPWQPRVAMALSYAIGSRDDPRGYSSLAHVVEHLTFRGSRHMKPLEIFAVLDRSGASDFNGTTSRDDTTYYAVVPSAQLATLLWIESERMAFTLERFNQADLELERKIVESELRLRNLVYPDFYDHILAAAFGAGHPYCAPENRVSELDAIDLEAVRWFFQQGYRPSNARLVLVGDFDPAATKELVHRYFAAIRNPTPQFARARAPALTSLAARDLEYEQRVYQQRLILAWRAPAPDTQDRAALQLVSRALSDAIQTAVVDNRRVASTSALGFQDWELGTLLMVQLALMKDHEHEEALLQVDEQLRRVTADEVKRAIASERAATVVKELEALQDPLARALRHLESLRKTGRPFDLAQHIDMFQKVTPESAFQVFERYVMNGKRLYARLARNEAAFLPARGKVTIAR